MEGDSKKHSEKAKRKRKKRRPKQTKQARQKRGQEETDKRPTARRNQGGEERKKNQSDVIRTRDLLYPKQIHYQTMLHSVVRDLSRKSDWGRCRRQRRGVCLYETPPGRRGFRRRHEAKPNRRGAPEEVAVVGIEPTACGL